MYRARTAKGAENAAIQGIGGVEFDTQELRNLQEEILSSPRGSSPLSAKVASVAASRDPANSTAQRSIGRDAENHSRISRKSNLAKDEVGNIQKPGSSNALAKPSAEHAIQAQVQIRRNSKGRLRDFIGEGEIQLQPKIGTLISAVMEDLTQKSSMSLTQENPESVYEQFNIQRQLAAQFRSTATPDEEEDGNRREEHEKEDGGEGATISMSLHRAQESLNSKQHTESTGITYHENDTGHVNLDFNPSNDDIDDDDDDVESQDASFPAPEIGISRGVPFLYEPETPAQPINPFAHKGTVLKGHELFGATQTTPMGPNVTSPTSSRPSPNVFNDFSSPAKRRGILGVSPLAGDAEPVEVSPLHSSVRRILARSTSDPPNSTSTPAPRISGVQSFNAASQQQSSVEPRPYVSMKESQERRRGANSLPGSDTDESDSELLGRRKRERLERIQRELSTVGVVKRDTSHPGPSNSPSVIPAEVEVPSTSRRRSQQEDYIAQCDGFDARDTQTQSQSLQGTQHTQQDDIIADSQGIASRQLELQQKSTIPDSPAIETAAKLSHVPLQEGTYCVEGSGGSPVVLEKGPREPESRLEPSLPLQEVSFNSRTPARGKSLEPSDGTVPETSPQRFRPMGEIANISFSNHEELNDIPGFTQDVGYENAMGIQSSPPQKLPVSVVPVLPADQLEKPTSNSLEANLMLDGTKDMQGPAQPETEQEFNINNEQPSNTSNQPLELVEKAKLRTVSKHAQVSTDKRIGNHSNDNQTPANADETISPDDGPNANQRHENVPAPVSVADSPIISPKKRASRIKKYGKGRTMVPLNKPEASNPQTSTHKRTSTRLSSTINVSSPPRMAPGITPQRQDARPATRKSDKVTEKEKVPSLGPQKRTYKRKSGVVATVIAKQEVDTPLTRSSRRQSRTPNYHDDSEDPLALPGPVRINSSDPRPLFEAMAFAVSYVKNEKEKNCVVNFINENGGLILNDGFDELFKSADVNNHTSQLELSTTAKSLKFAAIIADEHSRKAKYMQALALGLPSISGRWIQDCISKHTIIDWLPYLLCAGQSSFLGNAYRSRTLQPYSATDANLQKTIDSRGKLLEGQSVLVITGRGKAQEKRQVFLFLDRAVGPVRIGHAVDYAEARKMLLDAENQGQQWDLLHVDNNEKIAESAVFGSSPGGGSKKRKRGPSVAGDEKRPKKIRIINDETMIQSLIFGQLLEE